MENTNKRMLPQSVYVELHRFSEIEFNKQLIKEIVASVIPTVNYKAKGRLCLN